MLTVISGEALEELRKFPNESVQCCITSPPYWGLRDYSVEGQLGLEATPEEYVSKVVEIFRGVRRVLRKDGTLWLNLGDSYWGDSPPRKKSSEAFSETWDKANTASNGGLRRTAARHGALKAKDLCGIPWRVAFALQADGWWLRSDIIWNKPNPMPESVTDRPTKSHEYIFLLTKSSNYFYDAEAIKEKGSENIPWNITTSNRGTKVDSSRNDGDTNGLGQPALTNGRNKRSVWTVATAPYREAHFATYPPDLIKPCIMAGTSAKGCCAMCGAPWERVMERWIQVAHKRCRMDLLLTLAITVLSIEKEGRKASTVFLSWKPKPSAGNRPANATLASRQMHCSWILSLAAAQPARCRLSLGGRLS